MRPLFISFCTVGNGYEAEADELVKTLDAFDLPHRVARVAAFSGWQEATQYKPVFIRDMMLSFPGRPLVWLDADARVRRRPELFDELAASDADFAGHWLNDRELLAGSLYFGATLPARWLIDAWIERNRANPDGQNGDQRNLQDVIEARPDCLSLPPEYCWIDGISTGVYGEREPVIDQLQASRRLRS